MWMTRITLSNHLNKPILAAWTRTYRQSTTILVTTNTSSMSYLKWQFWMTFKYPFNLYRDFKQRHLTINITKWTSSQFFDSAIHHNMHMIFRAGLIYTWASKFSLSVRGLLLRHTTLHEKQSCDDTLRISFLLTIK